MLNINKALSATPSLNNEPIGEVKKAAPSFGMGSELKVPPRHVKVVVNEPNVSVQEINRVKIGKYPIDN